MCYNFVWKIDFFMKVLLMINSENTLTTTNLTHIGLVSAMVDQLEISSLIDKYIPMSNQCKVSIGDRVKSMIINGLGFTNNRLYLYPDYMADKPIEKLFNKPYNASDFNDDSIGRALDELSDIA